MNFEKTTQVERAIADEDYKTMTKERAIYIEKTSIYERAIP